MIVHPKTAQWQYDENLSIEQKLLLSALKACLCVVSDAVTMVNEHIIDNFPDSSKVVHRSVHYKWMDNNARYKEYFLDLNADVKDFGESQLHRLMRGIPIKRKTVRYDKDKKIIEETTETSDPIPDKTAVIFFNKTKNKDRGYIERNEVTGKEGESLIPSNMTTVNLIVSDPDPEKK